MRATAAFFFAIFAIKRAALFTNFAVAFVPKARVIAAFCVQFMRHVVRQKCARPLQLFEKFRNNFALCFASKMRAIAAPPCAVLQPIAAQNRSDCAIFSPQNVARCRGESAQKIVAIAYILEANRAADLRAT